jgi:hypothetical protein
MHGGVCCRSVLKVYVESLLQPDMRDVLRIDSVVVMEG